MITGRFPLSPIFRKNPRLIIMALTQQQQFLEAIKRSTSPLLCIPKAGGIDSYATALGLASVLQKLQKSPEIIAVDGPAPKQLHFLKNYENIKQTLHQIRNLLIEVDIQKTAIGSVSQQEKDGKCIISIVPEQGYWKEQDIHISHSAYRYDLLICIGANDLESYAQFYKEHPEFFYHTPIINIDHSPANEHYGQINLVDLNASACGEICYHVLCAIEPSFIDAEVATAFLTGMIAKTKSFKTANVNPQTLQTASQLIHKGADRERIIEQLYRTRSVSTLRLWGRALARLKHDPQKQLVWTLLSQQDFLHAGAEEQDLPDVIDELIVTSPDAHLILVLYEDRERNICAILKTQPPFDAMELAYPFRPSGTREEARMCFLNKTLMQAEKELLSKMIFS